MRFVIVIPGSLILLGAIFFIGSSRRTPEPQVVYPAPETAEAFLKRGKLHEKAGNYEKALADYTQAQQLDPSDSSAYLAQGSVLSVMDQPDDAIEKYLMVRKIDLQNDRSTRLIDYLIEKEREER